MNADEARRVREHRIQVFELEAGSIGRQYGVRLHHGFEFLEQPMLRFQILEDRLDHHVGLRRAAPLGVGDQAIHHIAQLQLVADALAPRRVGALQRRRDALHALVLQRHGQAAQRAPGGNVAAHDAGTDDMHAFRSEGGLLAEALQALLQEEHAHEIARRVRADDALDELRRFQRVAAVLRPDIDDRVRRRIVLRPRLLRDLLARTAGDDALERPVEQARQQRQLPPRRRGEHHRFRRALHHARRHALVGEAHALGAPGVDRLAGQHHVQCCLRPDTLRQAQHPAPAGEDTEHDFRQTHLRPRFVDGEQVTASQRQFETAAEAMAAHNGERRVACRGEPVEEVPTARNQLQPLGRRVELREFLDVGAGDEASGLARAEDQRLRRRTLELREDLRQLVHHGDRQRIGRLAELVERRPGDPVGVGFESPVLPGRHVNDVHNVHS